MNENVTIKTPKRRRWIARLLVSALCILLASSLLFVSVVAENVNSFELISVDNSISDVKTFFGVAFFEDGWYGGFELDTLPNGKCNVYLFRDVSSDYISSFSGVSLTYPSTDIGFVSYFEGYFGVYYSVDDGTSVNSYVDLFKFGNLTPDRNIFIGSGRFTVGSSINSCIFYDGTNYMYYLYYDNSGTSTWVGSLNGNIHGWGANCVLFDDLEGWYAVSGGTGDGNTTNLLRLSDFVFLEDQTTGGSFASSTCCYSGFKCYKLTRLSFGTSSAREVNYSSSGITQTLALKNNSLNGILTNSISSLYVCVLVEDALFSSSFQSSFVGFRLFKGLNGTVNRVYATSSEYTPPESSDETTTEAPPESSEDSSAGGVIDLYSYDRLSDGTYKSALIGTLDLTDATGLRVFLGMYLLGDNVWSDIKTPLTLLVYREDGSLDTYTYDYYAAGFAWGDGSAGSFTFPKFIGGYFDIPLTSSSELYFASSAPGGTIWLQNNSVVLRQINLLNSASYVELDNVSAEECVISVYDSPSDEDPESYVYTSGVLKYTLRKRNSSSSIPVSLEYGETGTVHGVMKYNGADFTVSSIILASDPDLAPPIYDFESMDNALSEAYDDVSRQQYLENLLTSYIENAYGTVSYDPDTSGAFLGGVDLMGDIVDSSGGSTIISAFVNMWSIHPFFPAMVGLLGTFLIFSFFLRKA